MSTTSDDDPAARYRAGEGATFTSSKCPPGRGLENTCELPFGFVWTPLAPSTSFSPVPCSGEALPQVLCLTCLAYLNLYASIDDNTGIWICPLCSAKNSLPKGELDKSQSLSSVLASPLIEYRQRIGPDVGQQSTDSICYVLVMDDNMPGDEARAVFTAIETLVVGASKSSTSVSLGLVVFGKNITIYRLGIHGIAAGDVYVSSSVAALDDESHLGRRNRMENRSYLAQIESQDDLNGLRLCISAVFSTPLQEQSKIQLPTSRSAPLSRKEQLMQKKEARRRQRQEQNGGSKSIGAFAPPMSWLGQQNFAKPMHPVRSTGLAVEFALNVASAARARTSRILLFTNGCPNAGDGSVVAEKNENIDNRQQRNLPDIVDPDCLSRAIQFFDLSGKLASEVGAGIDVFCTGASELGLPAYQALVEPSGGYVLTHETFLTPHLKHNLEYVLHRTYVSRGTIEDSVMSGSKLADGCILDIRMPSFVTPTHIVGPGDILMHERNGLLFNERSAFAMGASLLASKGYPTNHLPSEDLLETTLSRIRLGRFDPLSTMSVMLQINEGFHPADHFAFFQCVARFVDHDGATLVTRVSTHRLPVAKNIYDFLDAMEDDVVPVVLGKEAVYRSMQGREISEEPDIVALDPGRMEFLSYQSQKDLDATIQRVSGAFRLLGLENGSRSIDLTEEGGLKAAHSSFDFAFPPELADGLRRLFHTRRSSLLSPGPTRSADDRVEIRSLFLRLPLEDCLCMMAPSLWSTCVDRGYFDAAMTPVPPETLALWDNCIIAADHHDSMFVWSGSKTLAPEHDEIREQCKEFLLSHSKNRFPMPQLHQLAEGDSMSRRFTTRLAPSHADPSEHQIAHFPALEVFSHTEISALCAKFRFYDESSDFSFRNWFWNVASASSRAREEGVTLCE